MRSTEGLGGDRRRYPGPMERFLHSNPGLESRFNKSLFFPDYTAGQLLEIFRSLCQKNGYTLSPEADTKAAAALQSLYDHRGESFGNAREVRNFFEDAIARQADGWPVYWLPPGRTLWPCSRKI